MRMDRFNYVVIDCHNLAYRNWWHNRLLKTSRHVYSGMEYGFVQGIMKIVRTWQPAIPVLVWDGESKRCMELFPPGIDDQGKPVGYKSGRKGPKEKDDEPDWDARFDTLREAFRLLVPSIYHPDAEGDEEIASFTKYADSLGKTSLIISNDEDLHQLVTEHTFVLRYPRRKGEEEVVWGIEDVRNYWAVDPSHVPLRRAIEGDGSDWIPGIPRMPKSVIVDLVNRVQTIDELFEVVESGQVGLSPLQTEKIRAGRSLIERNYSLMDLSSQVYSPTLLPGTVGDSTAIKKLCRDLEMRENTVINRKEWNLLDNYGKIPLFE
jgi:5'-3' exonuclease